MTQREVCMQIAEAKTRERFHQYVDLCKDADLEPVDYDTWLDSDTGDDLPHKTPAPKRGKSGRFEKKDNTCTKCNDTPDKQKPATPDTNPVDENADETPDVLKALLDFVEKARGPAPKAPEAGGELIVCLGDGTVLRGDEARGWLKAMKYRSSRPSCPSYLDDLFAKIDRDLFSWRQFRNIF